MRGTRRTDCYVWRESDGSRASVDAQTIGKLCAADDGSLYIYDGEKIGRYSQDGQSGYKGLYSIDVSGCLDICEYGDELYVLTENGLARYDSETGRKNSDGEAWPEAVTEGIKASEQASGVDALSSHRLMHTDSSGDVVMLLGNGIYRYEPDTGLVVCLTDAQSDGWIDASTFYDFAIDGTGDDESIAAVCSVGDTKHIAGYSTQEMATAAGGAQSADSQDDEKTELRVYSLEEWDDIEVSLWKEAFEQKYPNITIEYEYGIPEESGITAADAVKTLNTQLLAGEGPDVIFMDGLDVQKYADAGLLLDLSDTYDEILEEYPNCLTNVISAYKTDNGVYAIPAKMTSIAVIAPENVIDSLTDISSLTEYIQSEGEPAAGNNLSIYSWERLFDKLYPVYASDIVSMDGVYSEDNLRTFLNDLKELNDLLLSRSTDEEIQESQQEYNENPADVNGGVDDLFFRDETGHNLALDSLNLATSAADVYSLQNFKLNGEEIKGNDDLRMKIMNNKSGNPYLPVMAGAVNASSKHRDDATLFVKELFGNEIQNAGADGIHTNMDALKTYLEELKETVLCGDTEYGYLEYNVFLSLLENFDEAKATLESLNTLSNSNAEIKEMIKSGMQSYCEGEKTLDEAVADTGKSLELYLSE